MNYVLIRINDYKPLNLKRERVRRLTSALNFLVTVRNPAQSSI